MIIYLMIKIGDKIPKVIIYLVNNEVSITNEMPSM